MRRAPRRAPGPDLARLGERLEALRREWRGRRLASDPLEFAHRFAEPADREIAAFLAASLAFGRVASIRASLERLFRALGNSPSGFLARWDGAPVSGLSGFVHRWVTAEDVRRLLLALRETLRREGSLRNLFANGDRGEPDFVPALTRFFAALRARAGIGTPARGLGFLLPDPAGGAACKRAHLFLRWAVRDEDFDLGLFRGGLYSPSRLLLPMDTHVHRISTYLGLTRRPAADLAAAREATAWLARFAPRDPVAYDWALSRLGILAECVTERTRRHCERCAVRPVCRVALPVAAPAAA